MVGEITEHRRSRHRLHRLRVVRGLPNFEFRGVAAGAGVGADVFCRLVSKRQHGHRSGSHRADHSQNVYQGSPSEAEGGNGDRARMRILKPDG